MKKALINIDYTNDFVATDGALTAGQPAQSILDTVMKVTKDFVESEDYLVFAIDTHYPDDPFHPESKLFPDHNIANTSGHDLYGPLEEYYQTIKDQKNIYYMEKSRYSAFAGTDLHQKLSERSIKEIHILGVCTDICVLHTAIDAYNLGYDIKIHANACASFNAAGHDWALGHFKSCLAAEIIED